MEPWESHQIVIISPSDRNQIVITSGMCTIRTLCSLGSCDMTMPTGTSPTLKYVNVCARAASACTSHRNKYVVASRVITKSKSSVSRA